MTEDQFRDLLKKTIQPRFPDLGKWLSEGGRETTRAWFDDVFKHLDETIVKNTFERWFRDAALPSYQRVAGECRKEHARVMERRNERYRNAQTRKEVDSFRGAMHAVTTGDSSMTDCYHKAIKIKDPDERHEFIEQYFG